MVRYIGGTWRVGGLLALSRAFGDAYLKGSLQFEGIAAGGDGYGSGFGVIAEPYTTVNTLTGGCGWAGVGEAGWWGQRLLYAVLSWLHSLLNKRATSLGDAPCRGLSHIAILGQTLTPACPAPGLLPLWCPCLPLCTDADTWLVLASDGLFAEEARGGGGGLDNETVAELCNAAGEGRRGWGPRRAGCKGRWGGLGGMVLANG